jgi:hypothetical protein
MKNHACCGRVFVRNVQKHAREPLLTFCLLPCYNIHTKHFGHLGVFCFSDSLVA